MKRAFGVCLVCGLIALSFHPIGAQQVYTGLIVDAKDLTFNPTASVKILDEEGREIYGSAYHDKQWVEKHGVVGYANSLADAKRNDRVGKNPHVVKAIRVTGPNNKDLVLAEEDARKVRELGKHLNFLDQAKVVIVTP